MLTSQIRTHFGIARDWTSAGYFETAHLKQLQADIADAIAAGRLVAISGPVGAGKTAMIRRLEGQLLQDKRIIVARSLSIDKPRVGLPALITALFLDISKDPDFKVPKQPERRERVLQELFAKARKPVVLFIDEAHDLHGHTLNGLKRLVETIEAGGGALSVVLIGHPRLQNDLKRSTMEEIGHRTTKFEFAGLGDQRADFLDWLLAQCVAEGTDVDDIITPEARDFLADRLSTPLQFAEHLNRAFTDAYRLGAGVVTAEIAEETISFGFDDLDARLARYGYTSKALAEQFDARPTEIRHFLRGKLDPERADELGTAMRRAGLPI